MSLVPATPNFDSSSVSPCLCETKRIELGFGPERVVKLELESKRHAPTALTWTSVTLRWSLIRRSVLALIACMVVAFEVAFRVSAMGMQRGEKRRSWIRRSDCYSKGSDFVATSYERTIDGTEPEVRPEVEQKYADEWNASGLVKWWFLMRRIELEIAIRIALTTLCGSSY